MHGALRFMPQVRKFASPYPADLGGTASNEAIAAAIAAAAATAAVEPIEIIGCEASDSWLVRTDNASVLNWGPIGGRGRRRRTGRKRVVEARPIGRRAAGGVSGALLNSKRPVFRRRRTTADGVGRPLFNAGLADEIPTGGGPIGPAAADGGGRSIQRAVLNTRSLPRATAVRVTRDGTREPGQRHQRTLPLELRTARAPPRASAQARADFPTSLALISSMSRWRSALMPLVDEAFADSCVRCQPCAPPPTALGRVELVLELQVVGRCRARDQLELRAVDEATRHAGGGGRSGGGSGSASMNASSSSASSRSSMTIASSRELKTPAISKRFLAAAHAGSAGAGAGWKKAEAAGSSAEKVDLARMHPRSEERRRRPVKSLLEERIMSGRVPIGLLAVARAEQADALRERAELWTGMGARVFWKGGRPRTFKSTTNPSAHTCTFSLTQIRPASSASIGEQAEGGRSRLRRRAGIRRR
ncbi:hypothetical protein T492DRAFT_1142416 [Pavlovales sp. CCMP2436]|nr:hypothetical protein T492DRAFT_1142416 [Pavlovales sp. CCMP2436]